MFSRFRTFAVAGLAAAAAVLAAPPAAAQSQSEAEPLARFEGPVCPGIVGLRTDAAELMVGRIRANLQEFGRRLAPESRCEPNLIVAVVENGADFMAQMRRSNSWVFAELSQAERAGVLDETGPARALLRVRTRSRDGMTIPRREDLSTPPQTTMWMAHSKIYTAIRNDIVSALVLFDADSVRGMTIGQLADYATFRALTRRLPETEGARAASILSLFDAGTGRPAGLTEFDRTYLGKLYQGLPNIPGTTRLAELEKATGLNVFEQ